MADMPTLTEMRERRRLVGEWLGNEPLLAGLDAISKALRG